MSLMSADVRVALAYMTLSVRRGNGRSFVVFLPKYVIENTPYSASMLTVSPAHVRDIAVTGTGIACLAKFPEKALTPQDRRAGKRLDAGRYEVHLTVDKGDVLAIHGETSPGSQSFAALYTRTAT